MPTRITHVWSVLNRPWVAALVAAAATFASRLPFLGSGYGRDPDAWRIVYSAYNIAGSGEYGASRLPGYPIPEFGFAAAYLMLPKLLIVVALLSAVAVGFFVLVAARSGCRDSLLAGLGFAMTPVVFINSTNAMDYMWAMAFIMPAWWFIIRRRAVVGGVLLGLAAGARITSLAMLVPFIDMLWDSSLRDRRTMRRTLGMVVSAVVVAVIAYVPVFMTHGAAMFEFVDDASTARVAYLIGEGVWGRVGLVALAAALIGVIVLRLRPRMVATIAKAGMPRAWVTGVGVYLVLFFRLPVESGYLLVIVPFVILLVARYVPRPAFWIFAGLLSVSSWVDVRGLGVYPGPILQDGHVRRVHLSDAVTILRSAAALEDAPTAVVAGWMTPQLTVLRAFEDIPPLDRDLVFVKSVQDKAAIGRRLYGVPLENLFPPGEATRWREAGVTPLPLTWGTPRDSDRTSQDSSR